MKDTLKLPTVLHALVRGRAYLPKAPVLVRELPGFGVIFHLAVQRVEALGRAFDGNEVSVQADIHHPQDVAGVLVVVRPEVLGFPFGERGEAAPEE